MIARTKHRFLFLALAALAAASFACNFPGRSTSPDTTPIPVSTEAVEQLESNVQSAATAFATQGDVTIEVTEEQLTSLVAFELAERQTEPQISNPQVRLRDGQVQMQGDVSQSGITAQLVVVMTVTIDADGRPDYQIVSANLGPLPLPDSMMGQLTQQLDSAMAQQLEPQTENLVIENITIADGKMTITGRPRA